VTGDAGAGLRAILAALERAANLEALRRLERSLQAAQGPTLARPHFTLTGAGEVHQHAPGPPRTPGPIRMGLADMATTTPERVTRCSEPPHPAEQEVSR
jgi:hypothetical protein